MSDAKSEPSMRPIRFATQGSEQDTGSGSKERLVNLFVQAAPEGATAPLVLRHSPGLGTAYTIGTGPVLQVNNDTPTGFYAVSGTHFYRLTNPGGALTITDMGDVGTVNNAGLNVLTSFVSIAAGTDFVAVCVPPRVYAAALTDSTVHQVLNTSDGPIPGVSSVAYLGGFFIYTVPDSSQWFVSQAFAAGTVDALDFAYADANPNILLRAISHLNRLWLFGQGGIEIWYLSGDADFPLRLDAGGIIAETVLAGQSIAVCDGSIFWMSLTGVIFRTSGYKAVRVSTDAIETQIADYFNLRSGDRTSAIAQAFEHSFEGHLFYVLTLKWPDDAGRTWLYDCATGMWHERSSSADGNGRWRASCAAGYLLGDSASGKLFSASDLVTTDDDQPSARIGYSSPIWNGTNRFFMSRFQLDCQRGGSPVVLDWTDDDGATWSSPRSLIVRGRGAIATRLGSSRRRTMRIRIATGAVRIYGAYGLIEGASS